jgi:VanZ family protein
LAIMAERKDDGQLMNGRWLLVALYVAVIFVLSAQPGLALPGTFELKDKLAHALEYAGLSWLMYGAVRASWPRATAARRVLLTMLTIALLGVGDEIFQMIVPLRDSSVYDWIADMVGASLAQSWCVTRDVWRGKA